MKENRGEMRTPRGLFSVQEVTMARLSGRVTSRLIATARGSVLYSVVVYYARRSSAEYASL